jgi:hypothetical protein
MTHGRSLRCCGKGSDLRFACGSWWPHCAWRRDERRSIQRLHSLALTCTASFVRTYCMSGFPRKPTRQTWPPALSPRTARPPRPDTSEQPDQFRSLNASLLYCPSCRVATPTRERLLLVLPTGNLYEYLCQHCGTSTGSKTDNS